MPRNILIFSDGTGQAGGLRADENRSNIYKLYRATRCGPDDQNTSSIRPTCREQVPEMCYAKLIVEIDENQTVIAIATA